jgi:hypothetical protein
MKSTGYMMHGAAASSFVFSLICLAGCASGPPARAVTATHVGPGVAPESGGFNLYLEVPRYTYRVGDTVPVTVRAVNVTDHPIGVESHGADLVRVVVYRHLVIGWQRVKQYPAMALPVRVAWDLPPHGQRTWQLLLIVEPDWPANEQLMLQAEINNGPPIRASVPIEIYSTHVKSSND